MSRASREPIPTAANGPAQAGAPDERAFAQIPRGGGRVRNDAEVRRSKRLGWLPRKLRAGGKKGAFGEIDPPPRPYPAAATALAGCTRAVKSSISLRVMSPMANL